MEDEKISVGVVRVCGLAMLASTRHLPPGRPTTSSGYSTSVIPSRRRSMGQSKGRAYLSPRVVRLIRTIAALPHEQLRPAISFRPFTRPRPHSGETPIGSQ